jgi:hypothetical protein
MAKAALILGGTLVAIVLSAVAVNLVLTWWWFC